MIKKEEDDEQIIRNRKIKKVKIRNWRKNTNGKS